MARKQSDYLASLLADEVEEGADAETAATKDGASTSAPPTPTQRADSANTSSRRASTSLLGRESALARIASGEVKQVTQLLLDPAKVRIWSGNARIQAQINADNCHDLIDSIIAEGGQKVPVVVRRVDDKAARKKGHDYELIAGTRRHFAISWLRANSYPDMKLLAQVADLDDEAAFRLADIENRARKDVSDIERARNYAHALTAHYGNHQTRMAERLKISKGWLSKMLKVATLPDDLLTCFPDWQGLALNPAYKLAQALDDAKTGPLVRNNIATVKATLKEMRDQDEPLPDAAAIIAMLHKSDSALSPAPAFEPVSFASKMGRLALSIQSANRQGVTIRLHAGSGASEAELARSFKEALALLKKQGRDIG
ncbi:ParB/RepB/Spo0J family partition protein [Alterisphingorhabdus coralli]|uniref:ParB/RepB/Spo0J family partition protein n=1 Tax=Alterisphingorhabdus coralli TaxID=3071408 RepID=A0AA97F9K9_9SPHN|nr:ParB/RepB/Spo0J family partition protein [Parasphingorhabdus sp. SCSIO 66989]WOE75567.1 ParB/RepB/Spo0J family partition protein [Parasphingorhabdus sp. SCSIO 66989]